MAGGPGGQAGRARQTLPDPAREGAGPAAAREGGGPTFEALALPHLGAVHRLALRLAGDPSAAEDLAQETFLRAMRAFPTLRDPARIRSWLFQILARLVIERHRTSDREVPLEDEHDLDRFSLFDRIAEEAPQPWQVDWQEHWRSQCCSRSSSTWGSRGFAWSNAVRSGWMIWRGIRSSPPISWRSCGR